MLRTVEALIKVLIVIIFIMIKIIPQLRRTIEAVQAMAAKLVRPACIPSKVSEAERLPQILPHNKELHRRSRLMPLPLPLTAKLAWQHDPVSTIVTRRTMPDENGRQKGSNRLRNLITKKKKLHRCGQRTHLRMVSCTLHIRLTPIDQMTQPNIFSIFNDY